MEQAVVRTRSLLLRQAAIPPGWGRLLRGLGRARRRTATRNAALTLFQVGVTACYRDPTFATFTRLGLRRGRVLSMNLLAPRERCFRDTTT